jgi:hypothetical protein
LDPWKIVHILGFITVNFLPTWCVIMAASSIFQAWISMRMRIGNFLNVLDVGNILDTELRGLGTCLRLAGWLFRCITVVD